MLQKRGCEEEKISFTTLGRDTVGPVGAVNGLMRIEVWKTIRCSQSYKQEDYVYANVALAYGGLHLQC